MTRLEAIKGSLDKWIAICAGYADVWMAENRCPLCEKYWHAIEGTILADCPDCLECPDCPLTNVGANCMSMGSTWMQIIDILHEFEFEVEEADDAITFKETIADIGDPKLQPLCEKMRDTLQALYDEEKNASL